MKTNASLGLRLALCFSVVVITAQIVAAPFEPLPDASIVAKGGKKPSSNKQSQPKQAKPTEVTLTGTIKEILPGGGGINVNAKKSPKDKSPKDWTIAPNAEARVIVKGTATVDYLRVGRIVEFTGKIRGDDTLDGKLKELTVVEKVVAKKGGSANARAANQGVGGTRIEAPKEASDVAEDDPTEKPLDAKAAPKGDPTVIGPEKSIAGKIVKCSDKEISVASAGRIIVVQLADMPTINVLLNNPKLVQVGAHIVAVGVGLEEKSGGNKCLARELTITLAEPLHGTKSASSTKKVAAEN